MSRQNISFSDDELGIGSADRLVRIISYPRFTEDAYAERLAEMRSLGVTSLVLGGRTTINGTRIAGKGCVGVVLKAKIGGKTCALKVRRVDADRKSMNEEARLHKIANDAGVGPHVPVLRPPHDAGHAAHRLGRSVDGAVDDLPVEPSRTLERVPPGTAHEVAHHPV